MDDIRNINTVNVVMDEHTAFHNSQTLLSSLNKKYGEQKVNLNISLKNCEIPDSLNKVFDTKGENILKSSA